jgi:hypothetical protein
VALFGETLSVSEELHDDFQHVSRTAFPALEVFRVNPDAIEAAIVPPKKDGVRRIVYGTLIHHKRPRTFFARLMPDDFVFFDNGMSSYWEHGDISDEFRKKRLPLPSLAALALAPPLPIPSYLAAYPLWRVTYEDLADIFASLQRAVGVWVPDGDPGIVLGTSMFRTGAVTWEEERELYLRVIDRARAQHTSVVFKGHPRAAHRPLIGEEDGVAIIETTAPIEALVQQGNTGCVYGMASTALFSMPKFFGWRAYRIEALASRRAAAERIHRRLADDLPALVFD